MLYAGPWPRDAHRLPEGQVQVFLLPRAGPQHRPRHLQGGLHQAEQGRAGVNNMPLLLQSLCKLQPFKSYQHKYCPDDCLGLIASVVVTSIYPANQALHGLVCQHNTVPGATGVRKLHKVMQS